MCIGLWFGFAVIFSLKKHGYSLRALIIFVYCNFVSLNYVSDEQ